MKTLIALFLFLRAALGRFPNAWAIAQKSTSQPWRFTSLLVLRPASLVTAMLCIAVTLSGCGFQLRGRADMPFDSIYVETDGFSLFAAELRRAILTGSKAKVVDVPSEAQVTLKIVGEQREKLVLAITTAGKVAEFQLRYRVAYRLTDRKAQDIVPPGEIAMRRDLTYQDTEVLAKESEEQLLYESMQADAVQQMLRRLSVLKLRS